MTATVAPENPAEIIAEINSLRRKKRAVILAHVYVREEIQELADLCADSLQLAQKAATTDAEIIVLCGVHFMAETAAILAPNKKVIAAANAPCAMADMLTADEFRELKAAHPRALAVTYVNSSAAIKAESDICCTSANAVAVVNSLPSDREIIFAPDKNLGAYVAKQARRNLILWDGFCPTHQRMLEEFAIQAKRDHPQAKLVVHPETAPEVSALADFVASTTGILRYCRESADREFIIGTEIGVLPMLRKQSPQKVFYPLTPIADCMAMKLSTLPRILRALRDDTAPGITVAPDIAVRARAALDKMLAVKI